MAGCNVNALEAAGQFRTAIYQQRLSICTPEGGNVARHEPGHGSRVSSGYGIYEVTSARPARQNELPVGREQSIAGAFQSHGLRHPAEFLHVEARALPGFIAGYQHSLAVVKPL